MDQVPSEWHLLSVHTQKLNMIIHGRKDGGWFFPQRRLLAKFINITNPMFTNVKY